MDDRSKVNKYLADFKILTSREYDVFRLRFGVDDGRHRTPEEVRKLLNLTGEKVKQIETQAWRKLRTRTTPPPKRPAAAAGIPREPIFFDYSPKKRKKKPG